MRIIAWQCILQSLISFLSKMKFAYLFAILFHFTFSSASYAATRWTLHESTVSLKTHGALSFEDVKSLVNIGFFCGTSHERFIHAWTGFTLQIVNAEKIKNFSFGEYEGPESKVGRLVKVALSPGRVYFFKPAVSYQGEDEGYQFSFEETKSGKELKKIVHDIQKGAKRLDIEIPDPLKPDKKLQMSFDVDGQSEAFSKLLCE